MTKSNLTTCLGYFGPGILPILIDCSTRPEVCFN